MVMKAWIWRRGWGLGADRMVEWKRGDDKREDLEGGHSIQRFWTIIRWGTARVSEHPRR